MESQPTPRITAPYLDSYQGRNVIVVGRVVQLRGEAAVIDADGNITAHLNRVRDDLLQLLCHPTLQILYSSHASFRSLLVRTQSTDMGTSQPYRKPTFPTATQYRSSARSIQTCQFAY